MKAQPIPEGTSQESVETWMRQRNIPGRALKALAASVWLLGITDKSWQCPQFQTWNGQAVIMKPLQNRRQEDRTPLLAGRVSQKKPHTQGTTDPWLQQDPWTTWATTHNRQTTDGTTNSNTSRGVGAPTEERFSKHQQQIDNMQETITKVTKALETQQQQQQAQQHETQKTMRAIREENQTGQKHLQAQIDQMQGQFHQQMDVMVKKLETSLTKQIEKQEQRTTTQFEKLQELLTSRASVTSPPRKKEKSDASM